MSNYTITTNFGAKDSLPSGDSNKVIKGSEFTTEFTNIQTAIATKADTSGASFTGAVTLSDSLTTTANINLGNSDKLVFGNTGQLQIYTDGTDSFITESGSGSLKIQGNFLQLFSPSNELFFTGVADGSASLFYNGTAHLATRLNGVSVYGGFDVDTDTLYVDDTNDRVGIGTTSPAQPLHIVDATDTTVIFESTDFNSRLELRDSSGSAFVENRGGILNLKSDTADAVVNSRIEFTVDNDEKMRIEATGSVLVGKTIDDNDENGLVVNSNGYTKIVRTSGTANANSVLMLNRQSTDGSIMELRKDDAVVGSIGTDSAGITFASGGSTERMRIDSSGNVGIGTTSPDSILHAQKANAGADTAIMLENSGQSGTSTASLVFTGNGGAGQEKARIKSAVYGDGYMAFHTNDDTEKMRIDSSGDLMVGTTDENAYNGGFSVKTGTVPYINVGHASSVASGNYYAAFRHGTNTLGTITQNGTTGVLYNTSSDERLKENIADSADAGSKIDAIQIRQFDWKSDGSHQDYGVIAQELVEVAPEAVHQPEDSEDMMGVDYSKLVPMLIKEVQSLRSRVAELENA